MGEKRLVHLIAYVKTSKVTDWKRIALHFGDIENPAFIYRSDDEQTFAQYAKKGAVVWIIESHFKSQPSLVARLRVAGQVQGKLKIDIIESSGDVNIPNGMLPAFEYGRKMRWYAVGDSKKCRFYGFNKASDALLKLELTGNPAPWRGAEEWLPRFGHSLQRPRLIKSGIEELEKLANDLTARSVFLSWKHCDFKDDHNEIEALINALVEKGIDCWWDQLTLPSSAALSRLRSKPELLKRLLDYGLAKSKILLILGSENWGSPSSSDPSRNWTLGEWNRSSIQFAYEIHGPPKDGYPAKPTKTFPKGTSSTIIVQRVSDYLKKLKE
jgi:hypothetical protein